MAMPPPVMPKPSHRLAPGRNVTWPLAQLQRPVGYMPAATTRVPSAPMDRQAPIEPPPRSLRMPNPAAAHQSTAYHQRSSSHDEAQQHDFRAADQPRSNFGPQYSSQNTALRRPFVPPIPTPGSAPDHPAEASPPPNSATMTTATTFRLDGFTGMFLLRLMQEKPGGPGPPDHLRGELSGETIEAQVLLPHVAGVDRTVMVEHGGEKKKKTTAQAAARTEKRRRDDERGKAPSTAGRKTVRFA